ncbi:MAG: S8 family serine peptidase [Flavobacterium sp. JAD_PAG50586_2]|nr:MAG: S8 family serine peptidase [Flavobacterium sp. JAD_PAG50586_2]
MNKIFVFAFFLLTYCGYSQQDAWVYFTDKPNSQYYFDNPLEMLSQRSLDRRSNQNIAIDIKDVPIHQPYVDEIITAPGIDVKAKSKWLNAVHVRGSVDDIQNLSSLTFVDYIQFADASLNTTGKIKNGSKNVVMQKVNKQMDTEALFNYGNSGNQIQMLNGHSLHQANYTGTGKIIAVLDSGFLNVNSAPAFERLFTNNLILGGYNYVSQSADVYSLHNHGTMTLSCMGGFVDGQLVGTAPDAQYYLFVTEDVTEENPVEESYWVEAAEEADRLGVDVISTSLGYYQFDNPNYGHAYSDFTGDEAYASKGANIAFSRGMIVVASAGNSGASAEPLNHVGVPAEATNVLAVGAVRNNEDRALFSSVGPSFDGRIKPDVMAQGQEATVAYNNVMISSGTSFSCPILAGMITSFWQAAPNLTNEQVIDIVKQSSDKFANPDNAYGYGIPDFQLALDLAQLSVNDPSKGKFLVYPNPTHNNLFVSFPNGFDEAKLILYNALGQNVFERSIQNSQTAVSLEDLNSGIYFYKINSSSLVQSGKIIKN